MSAEQRKGRRAAEGLIAPSVKPDVDGRLDIGNSLFELVGLDLTVLEHIEERLNGDLELFVVRNPDGGAVLLILPHVAEDGRDIGASLLDALRDIAPRQEFVEKLQQVVHRGLESADQILAAEHDLVP